ncbi:AraC family transcriptional regulator [Coraliomargarita parva]|uniref:AraC family transcriptional regulator n=1 Tax=Coraliomargarita parva TaxID=3014050 RepID=UPI0022B5E27C|nr:DNA-binding transcriptional regulator [Coraliomargarita parva]
MIQTKHVLMVLGSYDQSAHEGIARYAGQHAWHLNVSILKDFQLPEHWQGDGIITSMNNSRQLEDFILNAKVPTVDLSIWREDIDLPRVAADNDEIGRVGAQHFIEMGHRNCAWFALASNPVSQTRYQGYSDELAKAGIECIRLDTQRPQDAAFIRQRLLELPKPCAIYTKSDYDSAWLCNLCFDVDLRVPDDIAILGADDNPLICESQAVPLSSVRHDLKRIGYEGAAMLDQLMADQPLTERLKLIKPRGISVRKSTDALAVTDPLIREVLVYLKSHYRRSIGTAEIAEQFKLSRRSLELRFREQMHSSIREFLIRLRINEAKALLNYSKEPIETIAAMTGFCHAPHFSSTFKKIVGLSPTQFRKA